MKKLLLLLPVLSAFLSLAQYRYDNVSFKTVYWDELCQALQQNPGYLLLDVRSKGEYADTSQFRGLNIGHLNGAVNIDIREIDKRLPEIAAYKNKPVFVYCSHSQRSRRVSKLLSDSGFVSVFNINGGVSNLHLAGFAENCRLLTSQLPYNFLSPKDLVKSADYFILDIRSDSAFNGKALAERQNALGRFTNAVNIPLVQLEGKMEIIPRDRKILIVDENGAESPLAAEKLFKAGIKNIAVLFNGLESYLSEIPESERKGWVKTVPYSTINAVAFDQMATSTELTLLDVRTADEFNNKAKESFRNLGQLKGALNLPFEEWDKQFATLSLPKEKPVVVYAFSSTPETFEAAKKLAAQGYKNVYVLLGGVFNLRWQAANIRGRETLKDRVVNVPPGNL